jgi:hypothetical protein
MRGSPQSSKVAVCNLIGLIAAGISVSWWILYFTDFFPVFGGLLGLGGLFTWIAFVSNILTDERKAEMQQSFDRFVLQRLGLLIFLGLALFGWWIGFAPCRTTLLVDCLETTGGHFMEIREFRTEAPLEPEPVKRLTLSPRGTAKVLLATPWFGKKDYLVKISGFPARKITLSGYQRRQFFIPASMLQRPVVLIRPAAKELGVVDEGFSLEVRVKGNKGEIFRIDNYPGKAVWFGADEDVAVPERLLDQWRQEFKMAKKNTEDIARWLPPISIGPVDGLSGITEVSAHLLNRRGEIRYTGGTDLRIVRERPYPKEVVLYEKK